MRRPVSVTVSALLTLFGSAAAFFVAAFIVTSAGTVETTMTGGAMITRVIGGCFALFAATGAATAVGLLRLREWARVAILVIAGVLAAFCLLSVAMVLAMPLPGMVMPDAEMVDALRPLLLGMYAIPFAIAVWWLVLFTRRGTRERFAAEGPVDVAALPTDIAVIAWSCVAGGILCLVIPFLDLPAFLLGHRITGWSAALFYVLLAGAQLYSGWGLLRSDPRARRVAMGFFALGTIHGSLGLLVPGMREAAQSYAREVAARVDPTLPGEMMPLWSWTAALLVLGLAVPVWLLWRWTPRPSVTG